MLKSLLCSTFLLFTFSVSAQAPEPVPLARGNTPGEPHHHLKIENEYVRVYYVEVPPHENTQLHQHDHDYIYVSLGPSDVVNAIQNKPEIHLQLKDGETHFTRGGFAHVARNLADTPFRNVTIELLRPQGEVSNLCAQVAANASSAGCNKPLVSSKGGHGFTTQGQMETPEAWLDLVRLDPETRGSVALPSETLVVVLNDCAVQVGVKGQPGKTLQEGEVAWVEPHSRGVAFNTSPKPSSFLQLTFKGGSTAVKP
ncbi:MAG TPA: hypothetical protein VJN92_03865 [Candidatus Acidoferrum sp.]|nr:hypothetical protein [Candidatus Acidoferrum sp.]